jgi:hypothetical protein
MDQVPSGTKYNLAGLQRKTMNLDDVLMCLGGKRFLKSCHPSLSGLLFR